MYPFEMMSLFVLLIGKQSNKQKKVDVNSEGAWTTKTLRSDKKIVLEGFAVSLRIQNSCLNEVTWKSKCLEVFCIVHLRRYTHSEPKWGPQETVKLYTKICKKKVKGKVVGKVPCFFACHYSLWRECLQGDSCCWDCNYHVVMNKEWTTWVSRKSQTSYDKEREHMMMMVTTSEVWFSLFQRKNSHADGNNQCGVVWFSLFQRINPWADPRWQFSKNQRIAFDVELRFSQFLKKMGQRTNTELWFFADCFRKLTNCFRKPTMNLTCGVWWCPENPRVVVILPSSVTPKCALEQKRKRKKIDALPSSSA